MHQDIHQKRDESLFLNHVSSYIGTLRQPRIISICFFIALNIAAFTGLYAISNDNIWIMTGQKLFISAVLFFINVFLSIIIIREYNLAREIENWYNNKFMENEIYHDYRAFLNKRDKMRGYAWQSTKYLLSLCTSMPVAFILSLLLGINTETRAMAAFPVLLAAFAVSVYLLLSGHEYTYKEPDYDN